jgi:hypothetical protein
MRKETIKQLRRYGYASYEEYLRSPEWRERKRRMNLPKKCWICKTTKDLCAHHKSYDHICRERRGDIIVLCDDHHKGTHAYAYKHRIRLEEAHIVYARSLRRRPIKTSKNKKSSRSSSRRPKQRKKGIFASLFR